MFRRSIIIAFIISVLLLVSCGKKDNNEDVTLQSTASKIVKLSGNLPENADNTTLRRFIAEVKSVVELQMKSVAVAEDFIIVPVNVEPVIRGNISETMTYLGDIQAKYSIKVYCKMPERIEKYFVEEGDFVKTGDPIAQINDVKLQQGVAQVRAALHSAQTQLKNVEDEYKRIEKLYKENAVSESQYEQLKTQREIALNGVKQAQAVVNTTESQLSDALITAPIDGYVTNKYFEEGDMASAQFPVAVISQINPVKVMLNVVENKVGTLSIGMKADIEVPAFPNEIFTGTIFRISPTINAQTRTAEVEVEMHNQDMRLKPGMFSKVHILTQNKRGVLLVSKENVNSQTIMVSNGDALRESEVQENFSVFVVQDSLALLRPIKIGIRAGNKFEVISGLNERDLVISNGRSNVQDSSLVKVID